MAGHNLTQAKSSGIPQEEPWRFLLASDRMLRSRIRGIHTVEKVRLYLDAEVRNQSRQWVVAECNQRISYLEDRGWYDETDLPWTLEGQVAAGMDLLFSS